jgi:hypothetical protein
MSSHSILADDCSNTGSVPPRTKSSGKFLSPGPIIRNFYILKNEEGAGELGPFPLYGYFSTVCFWEIRQHGPPSDNIIAHAGDIYLDISTAPIGVYQNTSTGWISCWSELTNPSSKTPSRKEFKFFKLPHPRFKSRFLWTTKTIFTGEVVLSYITHEELNRRGGTEEDKQVYLLLDLQTFYPITTAETFVARKDAALQVHVQVAAALQAGKDTRLEILDSGSSSSAMDAGNESESDSMYVEEDLCDDEGNDSEDTEVESMPVSGGDSAQVGNANEDSACCKIEIAELAQSILEEVEKISSASMNSSSVKHPVSGDSSTPSSTSNPSESIRSLLSRLTAVTEKERKGYVTEINNCE